MFLNTYAIYGNYFNCGNSAINFFYAKNGNYFFCLQNRFFILSVVQNFYHITDVYRYLYIGYSKKNQNKKNSIFFKGLPIF